MALYLLFQMISSLHQIVMCLYTFLQLLQTPGMQNERLTRFKALIRWGYENDFLDDIRFLDKLKPLPDSTRAEKLASKFLEPEELRALLDGMKIEQWCLLTEFLALSGLRIGEAIALEFSDVSIDDNTLLINKTYDYNNHVVTSIKTEASEREVYIQPELDAVCRRIRTYTLKERIKYHFENRLFFCDINGDYIQYASYCKYLREYSEHILNRRITPHALRHTHTSLMAAAGVPLETISRRLGHDSSDITRQIYFHVIEGLKEKDREQIRNVRIL